MSFKLGRMMEEEVINVEDESSDDDDDLVQEVVDLNNQTSNNQPAGSTDSASEGDQWDKEKNSGHENSNKNRRGRRRHNIYQREYHQTHRAETLQKRASHYRKNKGGHNEVPKVKEMVTIHRVKDRPMIQSVESLAEECQVVSGEEDKDKVEPNNELVIAVSWSQGKSAQCPKCPYNAGASAVAEHVKTVHYKIKDFFCHICDFSSSMERHLKFHLKQKHKYFLEQGRKKDVNKQEKPRFPLQTVAKETGTTGRSEQCPKCPYTSKYGNLARHMRSAHKITISDNDKGDVTNSSGLKYCEKGENAGNGKQTEASHTTEDFKCKLCPFASGEKDELITHVNGAHRSSFLDEEPEPPQAPRSKVTNSENEKCKELGDNVQEKHEEHGGRQPNTQVPSHMADYPVFPRADIRIYKVQNPPSSKKNDEVVKTNIEKNGQQAVKNAAVNEIPSHFHQDQVGNNVIDDQFRLSGIPGLFGISGMSTKWRPYPAILRQKHPEASQSTEDLSCNLCPFAAGEKDELTRHVNAAHSSSSSSGEEARPFALAQWKRVKRVNLQGGISCVKYQCLRCAFEANTKEHLFQHITNVHGNAQMFSGYINVMPHVGNVMPVARETFKCQICSFSAASETLLNQHVGIEHTRLRQARPERDHDEVEDLNVPHVEDEVSDYKCHKCNYSSSLESDLTMHVKSAHAKSIRCDRCSFFTEEETDFKEHVTAAHGSAGDDKVEEEEESECILGY